MGMTCGVCSKLQKQGSSSRLDFFLDMARTPLINIDRLTPDQVGCRERVSADVQANNLVDGPNCDGGSLH
jgi:hypothetical protein